MRDRVAAQRGESFTIEGHRDANQPSYQAGRGYRA
jgi:hypothetical protein